MDDELAIITFQRNLGVARRIQEFMGGDILIYSNDAFKQALKYNSIIAIMAAGIAVRNIAPLIRGKWEDPAVVVVDSGSNFAVPILGGHHGGNDLAKKLSCLGIIPVITTATEAAGVESVEGIAKELGCRIVNRDSTREVNTALLHKDVESLYIKGPKIVLVDDDVAVLKRYGLVVGIGANRGVSKDEVIEAVRSGLAEINASMDDVRCFASAAIKENEQGIIDAAAVSGKELRFVSHELINSIRAPTLSKAKSLGLNGVCEPAALAVSEEKKLLLKKRKYGNVTIALAR
ncbi:cobalamin biosynthesis protein CbiG [Candidatus Methanoperedens nitroreducens]|uniref:Cobalamin biosynthesis protein CbiG n=1 Tax=Candidatus Methanoperedens nitratireducens TaxID=1392998 RepID=A0A062V351_9EURY|nr:cobalt-precorrin 5A hydrolase [Candidatus Methanoperedens nitroreducens]KCZ71787.1 cobalamin biosynthesis protein CbiG [Candidatus Methanoperedens nitroreducens]MDJ1422239.1 cobalt-precorrin 5A hydrolase [Candidatus Methanoperedens sp.]